MIFYLAVRLTNFSLCDIYYPLSHLLVIVNVNLIWHEEAPRTHIPKHSLSLNKLDHQGFNTTENSTGEYKMTLAQVVYNMSTDRDFASELLSNPELTLANRGLQLSQEELNFLLAAEKRENDQLTRILALAEEKSRAWV
jgi:hypothetical protein